MVHQDNHRSSSPSPTPAIGIWGLGIFFVTSCSSHSDAHQSLRTSELDQCKGQICLPACFSKYPFMGIEAMLLGSSPHHTAMAGLRSCDKDPMTHNPENICSLALYRKNCQLLNEMNGIKINTCFQT